MAHLLGLVANYYSDDPAVEPAPDEPVLAEALIAAAAEYLAGPHERTGPVVPDIRNRFGLTTPDALAAIRLAEKLRDEKRLP